MGVTRRGMRKNETINKKKNKVTAKMSHATTGKTGLRKLKASRLMSTNNTAAMEILLKPSL